MESFDSYLYFLISTPIIGEVTFLVSLFIIWLALKFFPKLGLMDRPHRYGLKREPIPYYGGLAIFLSFLILVFLFVDFSKTVIGLLTSGTLIVLVGFLDDLFGLSPFVRLLVQFVAAILLAVFGIGILSMNLPFMGTLDFTIFEIFIPFIGEIFVASVIFTVFWVLAIVNTMNLVDGVGGLASGVSAIGFLTIYALSINPAVHENPESQIAVAHISLILAVICFVFFMFEFPKKRILMGDTGSTFLGFMLATLAIFSGGKVATAFLVLGIPILDMAWAILRRVWAGKKFWQGDLGHLHHRLIADLGLSERSAVIGYLSVTAVLGIVAVNFVSGQQKFFMLIGLMALMALFLTYLVLVARRKQK